jgi:hypothetical protein
MCISVANRNGANIDSIRRNTTQLLFNGVNSSLGAAELPAGGENLSHFPNPNLASERICARANSS